MRTAILTGLAARAGLWFAATCAGALAAQAAPCDPALPFERLANPQATIACLQSLAAQAAGPLDQAFWLSVAAAEQAVQTRDTAAIGQARDALAAFARQHAQTVYGARALVHAARMTNDQQGLPLVAIPMYRQARTLFAAHSEWPPVAEHLADIEVGIGDAYMTLGTHGQAGKVWEEALQRYPATRAAQRIPARLRQVYAQSRPPRDAAAATLAAYDAVLGFVSDPEARGRLLIERLDVIEEAARAGLMPGEQLVGEAQALLDAFPEGISAHVDMARQRLHALAGTVPADPAGQAPEDR